MVIMIVALCAAALIAGFFFPVRSHGVETSVSGYVLTSLWEGVAAIGDAG